jgi:hypothetical protein
MRYNQVWRDSDVSKDHVLALSRKYTGVRREVRIESQTRLEAA